MYLNIIEHQFHHVQTSQHFKKVEINVYWLLIVLRACKGVPHPTDK